MKTKLLFLQLIFLSFFVSANNIKVSNITLENLNEPTWVQIEFDLSWENSWRLSAGPSNYDAAWVFIKYRVNSGDWAHAQLAQTDFVAPTGSTLNVTSDGIGALVYRDSDGSGDFNLEGVRLRWDYGAIDPNDIIDIQVFAVEMVYVPESSFFVGGTTGDEAGKFFEGGNTTQSFEITSESAIAVANSPGNIYYNDLGGENPGDQLGPIPANFPKGFAAFYCMKYEVSQQQYVDFFNTLTEAQKITNDITGPTGKNTDGELTRNGISWGEGSSSATTTNPDIALNYVNNDKLKAYLDWAGLRPHTELEYEKACRGPIEPKPGEFAWGNSNIATTIYTYLNEGEPNEIVSNPEIGVGNVIYVSTNGTPTGPKRVGILAASAVNKNREETGGSYYGIMELSGNLYERPISVGIPEGRAFEGQHGDGVLLPSGLANVTDWPSDNAGFGYRGASFFNGPNFLRISDRYDAASVLSGSNNRLGFRGVRTAD